jgi:hypothetical protein
MPQDAPLDGGARDGGPQGPWSRVAGMQAQASPLGGGRSWPHIKRSRSVAHQVSLGRQTNRPTSQISCRITTDQRTDRPTDQEEQEGQKKWGQKG